MSRVIKLKDAVGHKLAHDITEIRPDEFKGAAFKKGHTVCHEDLCRLQKLGKNHLYLYWRWNWVNQKVSFQRCFDRMWNREFQPTLSFKRDSTGCEVTNYRKIPNACRKWFDLSSCDS